jgi:hypothetical protein
MKAAAVMCSAIGLRGLYSTLEDLTVKISSNEMFCGNAGWQMQRVWSPVRGCQSHIESEYSGNLKNFFIECASSLGVSCCKSSDRILI